jgi:hypothetical protein
MYVVYFPEVDALCTLDNNTGFLEVNDLRKCKLILELLKFKSLSMEVLGTL